MGLAASHYVGHSIRADTFTPFNVDPGLTQVETNGESIWGTLDVPNVAEFLTNNPLPNGRPWGVFDSQTNYYEEAPNTGVIRYYEFVVSNGFISPDGYERPVLLVNGAFPGPLIEANWGDTIEVTVTNNITEPLEGLAIHWHGLFHRGTPWEDGAPAITQCPIVPEKSFTYQFKAAPYGTTWYHSHYSAQYGGGLVGPLIIHGPHDEYHHDIDLGPVMLTDWSHEDYYDLVEQTMSNTSFVPVEADNNLINGKNNFDCSTLPINHTTPCISNAGLSKFNFQRGKKHLLRLINAGSEGLQRFSIDGHIMTVVSNDFVDVEPYDTKVVTLGIGQRSNVVVTADGDLDAYWMRANVSVGDCGLNSNPLALAAVYYDDADITMEPQSEPWEVTPEDHCTNDDLEITVPLCPLVLPEPELTLTIDVGITRNDTGHFLWEMDGVAFMGNYNEPTLLWANRGNTSFPDDPQWNVRNVGDAKSVRVIVNNLSGLGHPMHLHGYNMYILSEGEGRWDNITIIRPENPQRRDVMQMRPNGYMVMQFDASENPGVWPFHCHIAWHVSGGFLIQFLASPEKVQELQVPQTVWDTCHEWGIWTETNVPPQIDSGL